ncbi:AgmX/PglI C-terminal domain-containing protein [Anaeromyxobacter oryzisoli]|uniref:AgmX/PglI C-terminal domain-containing protein n=1 Tax=Anaeromyxobacter oryzisoli TaxID=2925408 RepID=UPI001F598997|nr:AgmX/PglI C-terminal domain-containing protein [Anaeromyxobacter sp. SG63]
MTVRATWFAAVLVLALASRASAQVFPSRGGESGILDVPDAEVVGVANGKFAAEVGFDRVQGSSSSVGALPLYTVAGLGSKLEAGLTMRQWGQPSDPRPGRTVFGTAAKFQLLAPDGGIPGVAVSTVWDRFNDDGVFGARLTLSTRVNDTIPFRVAAFVGAELETTSSRDFGATAGLAVSMPIVRKIDLVAQALTGPRGGKLGGAIRLGVTPTVGLSLGTDYFPGDDALRTVFGIAISPSLKAKKPAEVSPKLAEQEEEPTEAAPDARLAEDRPHFRLRLRSAGATEPRSLQYGPYTPRSAVAAVPATIPARADAPTVEEIAEGQLREQESVTDARARSALATSDQLDAREQALFAQRKQLESREREIAAREQQLDAREQRIAHRAKPTPQARQLESLEQQLAAHERQALAVERSFGPTLEAADGRVRDAASREDVERREADRLTASVTSAPSRAQQLELRKQALAAKNRQLAAYEARFVARGEKADATERQLRSMNDRLDARNRRLDARSERLDLLEKIARSAAETRVAAAPPLRTNETTPAAATPKEKAVFVMVVKSPTAIVKDSKIAAQAPSTTSSSSAVEKAVAAATIVTFPTPASQLSELDRDTIDGIAKLAAKDGCELLIWARAKDPSLMGEAQRRAGEIRSRVISVSGLDTNRVVTRITTRPGSQGVDVVISALRQTKTNGAVNPASSSSADPGAVPGTASLLSGESGKRQIREAVQAAQPSIEACVGEHLQARQMKRAEGALKLTISPRGRIAKVTPTGTDLAGEGLEGCLGRAAAGWQFPTAETEYAVDVPITVLQGAAK